MHTGRIVCLLISVLVLYIDAKVTNLEISTYKAAQIISDKFLSIAIDTGQIRHNWAKLNFSSPKLESLAKALSPCYIRIGGSYADFLQFSPDEQNVQSNNQSDIYFSDLYGKDFVNFTMSARQWDEVNVFVGRVGWDMIFDLNSLLRQNGQWLPDNAKLLMDYTSQKGYKIAGWELGNEPNAYKHKIGYAISASQRAKDYMKLQTVLNQYPQWRNNVIIGPSTTQPKNKHAKNYFLEFLNTGGPDIVTNPTFHHYYVNGREATIDQFMDPEILNSLAPEIETANNIAKHPPYGKICLGETGSAYGGGADGLSNSYVAGFMWLDKLGLSARLGVDIVVRQSFYGGSYELIDSKTLDPLPDYWLSNLYKILVGRLVLNMTVTDNSDYVRIYAHCTNSKKTKYRPGSITLYGMNLLDSSTTVAFPQFKPDVKLDVFMLQPVGEMGLKSQFVALNGRELKLNTDFSLPNLLTPVLQIRNVTFPPKSFGFIVIPDAEATACSS